jgi:DNA-binding NtrC family response regulator
MGGRIVLIDDEARLVRGLKKALEFEGFEVADFTDPQAGLAFIRQSPPDLVVSDIRMRGMTGLEILEHVVHSVPQVPVVLMTAYSSLETAVAAMRLGARDYLLKPFEIETFTAAVRRVLAAETSDGEDRTVGPEGGSQRPVIIGRSAGMRRVLSLIERVATTDSTVLLQGESGTGKELAARALHTGSRRADRPFVAVNCSAIPDALFESEVFGHVRGSFTNAFTDKVGLFQEADGGTLFLDEIGDLPLVNQAKLLRVLQDGSFKRVGDVRPLSADVRVIAATNRILQQEVGQGRFREDLLYRLSVVEIDLPPLRERHDDLPALVEFFLQRFARKHRRPLLASSSELIAHLQRYHWPGNVRELENHLERAVILHRGGALAPVDIPLPAGRHGPAASGVDPATDDAPVVDPAAVAGNGSLTETMDRIEEKLIRQALATTGGNFSRAAAMLGVTRQNLHYKLKKYRIRKSLEP